MQAKVTLACSILASVLSLTFQRTSPSTHAEDSPCPTIRRQRRWQTPCWTCSPQGRRGTKRRWEPGSRCTTPWRAPADRGRGLVTCLLHFNVTSATPTVLPGCCRQEGWGRRTTGPVLRCICSTVTIENSWRFARLFVLVLILFWWTQSGQNSLQAAQSRDDREQNFTAEFPSTHEIQVWWRWWSRLSAGCCTSQHVCVCTSATTDALTSLTPAKFIHSPVQNVMI